MTAQYRQAVMQADHPVTVCQNLLPHSHIKHSPAQLSPHLPTVDESARIKRP